MFENYDDVLNVNELCHMLKIGKNTAYKLLSNGEIKAITIGKVYKIPKKSVIDFVQIN
ncbi:MAG: excisionase [Ignavibacteriae bacterium HGW-Ignavibacteriae-4]|jgi:excisionase family DNA binding protein|nr:MAG: excisionase [Ignavibacteriae bacterium HGW-Ignavibacteriae-4]